MFKSGSLLPSIRAWSHGTRNPSTARVTCSSSRVATARSHELQPRERHRQLGEQLSDTAARAEEAEGARDAAVAALLEAEQARARALEGAAEEKARAEKEQHYAQQAETAALYEIMSGF